MSLFSVVVDAPSLNANQFESWAAFVEDENGSFAETEFAEEANGSSFVVVVENGSFDDAKGSLLLTVDDVANGSSDGPESKGSAVDALEDANGSSIVAPPTDEANGSTADDVDVAAVAKGSLEPNGSLANGSDDFAPAVDGDVVFKDSSLAFVAEVIDVVDDDDENNWLLPKGSAVDVYKGKTEYISILFFELSLDTLSISNLSLTMFISFMVTEACTQRINRDKKIAQSISCILDMKLLGTFRCFELFVEVPFDLELFGDSLNF